MQIYSKNKTHIVNDFSIKWNKTKILKSLDCFPDSPVYDVMEEVYDELIEDIEEWVHPTLAFYIEDVTEDCQIAELKDCTEIIYMTATIGEKISNRITEMFEAYDQMEAMLLDAVATSIIMTISEQVHQVVYNYIKDSGFGAKAISPGEFGANIEYQTIIEEKMNGENNISVTNSFLLEPIKSSSKIYGLKQGIPLSKALHNCGLCMDKTCKWRSVPYAG
ncbi:MAG: hypothetical protein BEN19_08920 [Epulopiscium sp. Nuni2H_MBin003]|nr:MAG: hypothetical protein BEN19_08920 [Epulopiscium sp. Nuni2H_MBin003]